MSLKTKVSSPGWDTLSVLLLLGVLLTVTIRANLTGWTVALAYLPAIALLSTFLGCLLGVSRFRHIGITSLVGGYSFIILTYFFLRLDESPLPLYERLSSLGIRLHTNLQAFAHQEALGDAFLFTVLGYLLFWILGLWCGFVLIRHNQTLGALIPPSLVLTALYVYDPSHSASMTLWSYLTFSALLVARRYALQNQGQWKAHGTLIPIEAIHDLTAIALQVTLIALTLAWIIPWALSPSSPVQKAWERLRKTWEPAQERLSNIVEPLQRQGGEGPTYRRLALGLESARGEEILFTIETPTDVPVIRYYWREQAFDRFENNVWTASAEEKVTVSSWQDLPVVLPVRGSEMQLVFNLYRPSSWIYTFATPRNVDTDTQVSGFRISTTTLDLLTLQAGKRLEKGQRYTILTRYIAPTSDDLRKAEGELPRWVLDRYLQLPSNFSPRLRALAAEIAGDAPTRYDKAEAITRYLREHITYAERIPPPPPGQDVMEWFLFEHRQGFCNYYATAEVLLLRAIGVPARLATGYAQGETQENGRYIVRERHAHAWPEVYFPGWGWVEFEPTANQTALVRPVRVAATSLTPTAVAAERRPPPRLPKDETIERAMTRKKSRLWILLGISVGAFLFFLVRRYVPKENFPLYLQKSLTRYGLRPPHRLEEWARWSTLSPLEKSFEEINRALKLFGAQLPASATPAERAARLSEILPEARSAIEELLKEYQMSVYSKAFYPPLLARRAAARIRHAAWKKRYLRFLRVNL